jgi:U3 small nucleolar RNA-associated protein 20
MFCLKSRVIAEDLATQVVRNLVFLGRCFGQNQLAFPPKEAENQPDGELSDASDVDSDAGTPSALVKGNKPAIQYILEQASRILRREPLSMRAESLNAKAACMKLVAALCNHLDTAQILPSLQGILLPLLHLTDPSIPAPHSSDEGFESTYKSLVQSSQEILDLLQKKMGTSDFVAQISQARETMRTKREERRVKRRIEAVTDPAKAGLEKRRKHDRKRERRKERGHEFRGKRRGW